jgi:hypothetical protein
MLAYIGSVSDVCVNSGTPGVTTQDFTLGSGFTAVPVAARITVCASLAPTNDQPHVRYSVGLTDGTFQGGMALQVENGTATQSSDRVPFDDAVIRLLNPSGSYDAVGAFDSFIAGGIRILWNTIPTDGYVVLVELWFGDNVSVKAGFVTPPAVGGSGNQVTTGFEPDHIVHISASGLAAANETIAASGDFQLGHTVRTTGTSTSTRTMGVQFRDAVSGSNSTSSLTQIVGVTYRGGSLPFLVLSAETQITGMHATDGFVVNSVGASGTGPSFFYLAVSYGVNEYELVTSVTGTSDGEDTTYGSILAWSAMTLQTIRTGTGWNSGSVTTNASCFGTGSASFGSPVPETSLTGTNEDGVGTTNAFSWSDEALFAMPESGSPSTFYKAPVQDWPSTGGVHVQWNPAPSDATARQVVVFLLGRDTISGTGAGTFPLPTASGTASLTFQGTGAGTFPLATGAGTASLTFQGTGAGAFALPLGSGTASLTFQATGAGSFPLATAAGTASLGFQATGAGSFPLPTADGTASLTFQAAGAGAFALPIADGLASLGFQATGAGTFPLAEATGTAQLVFQGTGAGSFPLAVADGTGTVTVIFTGTGAGSFALPTADGLALLVFQGTGAGFFPLPTAQGFGPFPDLACQSPMEGDYDKTSVMSGDYDVVKALTGDYKTITDLEGDNC